jgi:cobalt/nickel transport system permease protein
MHIPDHMLQGTICPSTAAISTLGVAAAVFMAIKSDRKPTAGRFAVITALIFAGQMMNFPVQAGISGHLMGGVLASALLGTPFGVLSIALIVTVQALLFADGGVTALGANVFNMALVGAGLGGIMLSQLAGWFNNKGAGYAASLGLASYISLLMASLACAMQLVISGAAPFAGVTAEILGIHAVIGIGEAVITVAAFYALKPSGESTSQRSVLASAIIIAVVCSPFASRLPDGLAWVAEKQGLLLDAVPVFAGPLADYSLTALGSGSISTALAGLTGILITFSIAFMAGRLPAMQQRNRP